MANEHSSNKGEEDVVELKRALATGSASTQSNSASASAYGILCLSHHVLIEIENAIMAYSCAHCLLLHGIYSHDCRE